MRKLACFIAVLAGCSDTAPEDDPLTADPVPVTGISILGAALEQDGRLRVDVSVLTESGVLRSEQEAENGLGFTTLLTCLAVHASDESQGNCTGTPNPTSLNSALVPSVRAETPNIAILVDQSGSTEGVVAADGCLEGTPGSFEPTKQPKLCESDKRGLRLLAALLLKESWPDASVWGFSEGSIIEASDDVLSLQGKANGRSNLWEAVAQIGGELPEGETRHVIAITDGPQNCTGCPSPAVPDGVHVSFIQLQSRQDLDPDPEMLAAADASGGHYKFLNFSKLPSNTDFRKEAVESWVARLAPALAGHYSFRIELPELAKVPASARGALEGSMRLGAHTATFTWGKSNWDDRLIFLR